MNAAPKHFSPPSVSPEKQLPITTRPPEAKRRNLQLDVLRSIAILLVIGAHMKIDNHNPVIGWIARAWHDYGRLGVPIFFALSGYLISGLILDELRVRGTFRIGRFLIRRGLKLYPAYFVFIAYLIAMPLMKTLISGGDALGLLTSMLRDYWPNLLFMQNYVGPNPAAHTWSLAVEEHFYIMLSFLILWMHRRGWSRWLTLVGLLSPLVFTVVRLGSWYFGDPYMASGATHLCLDGLGMGVGLRSLKEHSPLVFGALGRWRWLWIATGSILLVFFRLPILPITPVGSTMLLLGGVHLRSADFGCLAPIGRPGIHLLAWIGVHSYSIYLWHVTFMGIVSKKVIAHLHLDTSHSGDWLLNRTLIVVAVILGGWIAARLIEWPVLHIRDRYFPRLA